MSHVWQEIIRISKKVFKKELLIEIYFVLFIILNVIDFLNLIPNDLDFFKKLLSWTLIGLIFYDISITKLLIGVRLKLYDIFYIIAYSLMVIIRMIGYYINNYGRQNLSKLFPIFGWFLIHLPLDNNQILLFFLFGTILSIILTVILISNYDIKKDSFLGSFNFKETFFDIFLLYVIAVFYTIFFGLIVFGFFMEWFALAVDSLILVIGLCYYVVYMILKYTGYVKIKNLLSDISSFGENVYYNLIKMFSDKKTFFVGVASLLFVHLIVDFGVYFVPYLLGNKNSLYFASKNFLVTHRSLFSLFVIKNALFIKEIKTLHLNIFNSIVLFIFYLLSYIFFSALMLGPGIVYYKNLINEKMNFSKLFSSVFVSILIVLFVLSLTSEINLPIKIKVFDQNANIKGVDVETGYILNSISGQYYLDCLFVFFLVLFGLFFKYYEYLSSMLRIFILVVFLIYAVYYIGLFFGSILNSDYYNLTGDSLSFFSLNHNVTNESYNLRLKSSEVNMQISQLSYEDIEVLIKNRSYYKYRRSLRLKKDIGSELDVIIPKIYTNFLFKDYRNVNANLSGKIAVVSLCFKIDEKDLVFLNATNIVWNNSDRVYDAKSRKLLKNSGCFYKKVPLGSIFIFDKNRKRLDLNPQSIKRLVNKTFLSRTKKSLIFVFLEKMFFILKLVLNFIFYLGGLIYLIIFFVKKNFILED